MTIQIIVEDGSNVPNANSYVSVNDVRSFATNRGVVSPSDDDSIAAMIILSMDYISQFSDKFIGERANDNQSLDWPRVWNQYGVKTSIPVAGEVVTNTQIPSRLKNAQMILAIAQIGGIDILPTVGASDYVVRETVGPITTQYSDPLSVGIRQKIGAFDSVFGPLIGSSGFAKTVRV